jgi:hypothetical protein
MNQMEFESKANKVHNNKYKYGVYTKYHSKIEITCPVHHKFWQAASSHLSGHGCPSCGLESIKAKMKPKENEKIIEEFKRTHGNQYDYSRVQYTNSATKVIIVCPDHGEFSQDPNSHKRGRGCPKCGKLKKSKPMTFDQFVEKARQIHGDTYDYSKANYTNNKLKVTIICKKHGEFEQRPDSHLHKQYGCPKCTPPQSKQEIAISDYLSELKIKHITTDREQIKPMELDIYIPQHNIGIEHNGIRYHSEQFVSNNYHRNKWQMCHDNGIQLIQIFEDEWRDKQNLIKRKLAAMTGNCQKYAARKCSLKPISSKMAGQFYRNNHMQGHASDMKISYGLFYANALVAAASFSYRNIWKVERYATTGRVQGGFSKIFKQFVKDHNPDSVLSYADLRWGNGNVFGHAGFKNNGITVPDYWWTNFKNRISRYKVQKRPAGISEREYCESMGLKKIYGVGHRRWIWKKNDPAEAGSVLIKPLKV